MKKRKGVIVIAGVIAAAALIFYLSRPGKPATKSRVGLPAAAAQEKPGSMPGMPGMPAEKPSAAKAPAEEAKPEAPTVEIPPEKQQLIGVKTATAQVQPLTKTIRTVGLVEYDQRRLNTINTKIEGWIEKLYVNFTGHLREEG